MSPTAQPDTEVLICDLCNEADEILHDGYPRHEECEDEVFAYRDQVRRAWLGL